MKKTAIAFSLLLASLFGVFPALAGEVLDGVAAIVNGELILISEVRETYRDPIFLGAMGYPTGDDSPELKQKALHYLIERKLMEQQARRLNITVTEQEIVAVIEHDVLPRFQLSLTGLQDEIKRSGKSWEEYKDEVRMDLMRMRVVERQLMSASGPDVSELRGYYASHPQEFRTRGKGRIWQILLPLPKSATSAETLAAADKAQQIYRELRDGASFEERAGHYSSDSSAIDGGNMGVFNEGELVAEIDRVAFALSEGEVSEPFRTHFGYHIVRVTEKEDAGMISFEDARPGIESTLGNKKRDRLYRHWMEKLKEKAHLKIFNQANL
jgi:peptidyl-prolyl cis-trans isomerase SurA